LVQADDVVQRVGRPAGIAGHVGAQSGREITAPYRQQHVEQFIHIQTASANS